MSLNTEDAELNKIMPWAGTSHGPQAFLAVADVGAIEVVSQWLQNLQDPEVVNSLVAPDALAVKQVRPG